MADGRWISTPVLGAVVHPGHMLWAPMPLWLLIAGTATVVGVAVGIVDGTGVRSKLTAVVGIGMYAFCARLPPRPPRPPRRRRLAGPLRAGSDGPEVAAEGDRQPAPVDRGRIVTGGPDLLILVSGDTPWEIAVTAFALLALVVSFAIVGVPALRRWVAPPLAQAAITDLVQIDQALADRRTLRCRSGALTVTLEVDGLDAAGADEGTRLARRAAQGPVHDPVRAGRARSGVPVPRTGRAAGTSPGGRGRRR